MNRLARLEDRGALAALLCGSALVILTILIVAKVSEPLKSVAIVAIPILWVAGVLALTPFDGLRPRGLATFAGVGYALAFILPAATGNGGESTVWGFQAFVLGITVVPFAWSANIAFVGALELHRRGQERPALWLSAIAVLLALTAPLMLPGTLVVSVGFVDWAAAPAILAVSSLLAARPAAGDATEAVQG